VNEPWWIDVAKAFVVANLVLLAFAYATWLERKVIGRMQQRYGPNRAGPYGLLQPIADLIKLIRKESFFPTAAIDLPYIVAPVVSAFTALAAFAVIPYGNGWNIWHYHVDGVVANVSIGLILIFALGTASSSAVGRASRSSPCSARCAPARSSSPTRSRSR
jgi:NADH-quinone oxidoreductase subunit H